MKSEHGRAPSKLVVGGHSFIAELGNDPAIDFGVQLEIVNTCLDSGITCFDTTYEPERLALGRILAELKRRDDAQIVAWNFFSEPATGAHLVAPRPFMAGDISLLLQQLGVSSIDLLVVHPVDNAEANARQIEVALSWQQSGFVRSLGTWAPGAQPEKHYGASNPYQFMVAPRNLAQPGADVFRAGKALGWRTFATSPFGRGWLLDRLLSVATQDAPGDANALRARLADAMLRFSLFCSDVDHVIVGIRKREWIAQNLHSMEAGPLSESEMRDLLGLIERSPGAA